MIPALAAAHLLGSLGTLLLLGGVFARRVLTAGHPAPRPSALGLVLLALWAALEVGWTLARLGFLTPGDTLAYVTGAGPGRAVLTGVLGGGLLLAAERRGWAAPLLLPPAALLLWGVAGVGHGAAHGPGLRALTALHAGAMGVWLGGVLALLTHPAPTPAQARRFTPVALACVGVLAASGAVLTLAHAGSPLALRESGYGRILLLKLGLFAAGLLAAGLVRRAFAGRGHLRAALSLEAGLLLGVLAVTAALGTTAPPPG
ncbi:CopD family protein [Deinococcus planocerae]|uniref:CopD family protein n=1 Tax=Deinococcus planocerae TaxID=1737569 RepID=UPI001FECA51E|nr:CopD family protein [Deinococcus planocerae]